ncbi:MAG: hydroxyacid dehydrogenase [Candidatus Kapaibacterium sp.]
MKIVIFQAEEWEIDRFKDLAEDFDVEFEREELDAENASHHSDAEIISTFIYSDLGRETLEKMPDLKLIATRSTGYDHIDLDYCSEHGIKVANVPSYGDTTVAEHVFGLLLTISHNIYDSVERVMKGEFSLQGLRGFDLAGKILGVVGTGSIGRHVIRIAKGFDMQVIAYDVYPDEDFAKEMGFEYVDQPELLRRSDIITLHVPSTQSTRHMLSENEFDKMKKGVIIINTARGDVIDNTAFLRALAEGKIKAAGLDVLPEEPVIREEGELLRSVFRKTHDLDQILADQVLIRLRNVYITPHNAFNTDEALGEIIDTTMDNIRAFIDGSPENIINE